MICSVGRIAVGSCTELPPVLKVVLADNASCGKAAAPPAAAMPPEAEGALARGAGLSCGAPAGGALPEGRISVVGPAAQDWP